MMQVDQVETSDGATMQPCNHISDKPIKDWEILEDFDHAFLDTQPSTGIKSAKQVSN